MPRLAVTAAAVNPMGRQHAIVARPVSAAMTGATFSPYFMLTMASAPTPGLIQGFDRRARRFGSRCECPIARGEMLMQGAPELAELLDLRASISSIRRVSRSRTLLQEVNVFVRSRPAASCWMSSSC